MKTRAHILFFMGSLMTALAMSPFCKAQGQGDQPIIEGDFRVLTHTPVPVRILGNEGLALADEKLQKPDLQIRRGRDADGDFFQVSLYYINGHKGPFKAGLRAQVLDLETEQSSWTDLEEINAPHRSDGKPVEFEWRRNGLLDSNTRKLLSFELTIQDAAEKTIAYAQAEPMEIYSDPESNNGNLMQEALRTGDQRAYFSTPPGFRFNLVEGSVFVDQVIAIVSQNSEGQMEAQVASFERRQMDVGSNRIPLSYRSPRIPDGHTCFVAIRALRNASIRVPYGSPAATLAD